MIDYKPEWSKKTTDQKAEELRSAFRDLEKKVKNLEDEVEALRSQR